MRAAFTLPRAPDRWKAIFTDSSSSNDKCTDEPNSICDGFACCTQLDRHGVVHADRKQLPSPKCAEDPVLRRSPRSKSETIFMG